jgi:hypothetical protein
VNRSNGSTDCPSFGSSEEAASVLENSLEDSCFASFSSSEVIRDWILSSRFEARVESD